MKTYGWRALCILSVLLVGVAWTRAAPSATINWDVIAGGGDSLEQGTLSVDNTLGQPVAGAYSGTSLSVGFWRRSIQYRIFVPIVIRQS